MRLLKLLEFIITEDNEYKLFFSKKYKKLIVKYSNNPANIKLLRDLEKSLLHNGDISGHGIHSINQPIKSEYTGKDEKGWKVVYVSKSDDLRLGYYRHKDKTIEVKFGKASDIGYKH